MNLRIPVILTACALAATTSTVAHAGACEDTFQKSGSAISGLRYIATATLADLPPEVAINQMRGIVARKGYDIIAAEPAAGALLIEQPMTGKARAFPIEINATQQGGTGTVRMEAKLRAGVFAGADGAKTEMCAVLAELRGGREGRRLASAGAGAATVQAAPVTMTAQAFSQQISKDAERNALAIAQRYTNKRFTLTGEAARIVRDGTQNRVMFKILQPHELALRLPNMASTLWSINCMMAPGTSVYTLQLKPGTNVRLTGTFQEYSADREVVWLEGCTPAQGRG